MLLYHHPVNRMMIQKQFCLGHFDSVLCRPRHFAQSMKSKISIPLLRILIPTYSFELSEQLLHRSNFCLFNTMIKPEWAMPPLEGVMNQLGLFMGRPFNSSSRRRSVMCVSKTADFETVLLPIYHRLSRRSNFPFNFDGVCRN